MLRRFGQRLLLFLISSAVAVALLELLLQLVAPTTDLYHVWPPHLVRRTEPPTAIFPGVSGPSLFQVSSQGLRADEWERGRDPVILALGGSTTECLALDQQEAWPYLLQRELSGNGRPAWVGNAGVSGRSTREHVFQVPILLEQFDTDILLVLAGINDLGLRLMRDADYDPHFLQAEGVQARQIPRAFSRYPDAFAEHLPWHKRTRLYALARGTKDRLAAVTGIGTAQTGTGAGLTRWRDNRRRATELRDELPDLSSALAEYERNLTRIVDAATERRVTVVLLTQPGIWRHDLEQAARDRLWWGGVGNFQAPGARVPYYSVEALAEGCAQYNAATLRVANRTGALAFDLAAAIPRSPDVFYDDMHFTEEGARQVATAVATFLREHALGVTR